jgi:transglutaminase-like putative cysteine protease/uncharacterized protein (DUF58 family)
MRPTRLGYSVLAADSLAFFGALISGNNLLYLVAGVLAAALAGAAVFNRRQTAGIRPELVFPDQMFQGVPFRLGVIIRAPRRRPLFPLEIGSPLDRRAIPFIPRRGEFRAELACRMERRGQNRTDDFFLETAFPFGFFRSVRRISAHEAIALPAITETFGRTASPSVREEPLTRPQRGVGDDFHGLREYSYGEDARLINWKLTAKTGRPVVKEYAHAAGRRVTVAASGAPGPGTEERIAEAASLVKFYIDSGAEVRLATDEGEIDYGRGLLHLNVLLEKLALLGQGRHLPEPRKRPSPRPRRTCPAASIGWGWLYAMTAAAFGSLFLIEEIHPLFLALSALIIPVGALLDRKNIHPFPKIVLDIGALLVLLFALLVDVRLSGMVRTVTHILLYVLAYSLWSPKTEPTLRRIFLTDFLLFFLASGQAVDLGYLPFFAAYFLTAGAWLIRRLDAPGAPARRPGWFRAVAGVSLRCLAAAALLFLVLPRVYSPRMQQLLASAGLTRFQNPAVSFAGLSDRVELGFFGPLRKNSARVMRVSFPSAPAGFHPPDALRVRAAAFDEFRGRRWVRTYGDFEIGGGDRAQRSRGGVFRLRGRRGTIAFPGYDPSRPEVVEEFFIYPMISTFVFSAGGIGAIDAPAPSASFDFNDAVYFPNLYTGPTRYRIHTQAEGAEYYRSIDRYEDILRNRFLAIPRAEPRWKTLAEQRTASFASNLEKAKALENWFRAHFSYSLAAADNRQDLDSFLWSTQAGNCEYFASAMTLLLRQIGIPSRLAIGFLTTEWNEFGGFFEVRQSDAHAWVEAFFPDCGWLTFDPTPPDLNAGGGDSVLAKVWLGLGRYVSAIEARWYRYIVGFDSETQKTLFDIVRIRWSKALLWSGLIALAASALLAVLLRLRPWRRLGPRRGRHPRPEFFYLQVLDRLDKSGFRRLPGQTAWEFTADVAGRRPDLVGLPALTAKYYQVRFAGRALTAAEKDEVQNETRRLGQALRAGRRHTQRFDSRRRSS